LWKIDPTPTFQAHLKAAAKKHPSLVDDLRETLDKLEKDHTIGDWIPGLGPNREVRKIRVGVRGQGISKRRGYRLIYWVDHENTTLRLLLFHFKPDLAVVPMKDIAGLLGR
jgi:mRNA-degrading endonuclease RelE of RelBE toxin-antitoxin system